MGQTESVPGRDGEPEALGLLLERALQGDAQALEVLVTLLRTEHYKRIIKNLHRLRKRASTQTIEDAFQDSILQLVEKIRSGELRDLSEKDRENVFGYIVKLCDRRVGNIRKPRLSPVYARSKPEVPRGLIDPDTAIPGDDAPTERHRIILQEAIRNLEPFERQILERHLEGVPYRTIAEETGKNEANLANIVSRAKQRLLVDILPRSPTAKLNYEKEREAALRKPVAEEIRAAVEILPPELADAVFGVHYEKRATDEIARKLGHRGEEKLRTRLKQAYRILASRLCAEFPEAFEEMPK